MVKVLYGAHRSTELIAMSVAENLMSSDLSIEFIEHEKWRDTDYVEVLLRVEEAVKNGFYTDNNHNYNLNNINQMIFHLHSRSKDYEKKLREQKGPLIFNLHDGLKTDERDIEFMIPYHVEQHEELSDLLIAIGKQNGLTIKVNYFSPLPKNLSLNNIYIVPPNNIVIEFYTPKPDETKQFPNSNIEELFNKHRIYPYESLVKMTDVSNPLIIDTITRYTTFMKEVLNKLDEKDL